MEKICIYTDREDEVRQIVGDSYVEGSDGLVWVNVTPDQWQELRSKLLAR